MELEEKKKLLEQKIAELEVIFKGNGLESLKGLNFDIQTNEPFIPTTEVIDEDRTREGNEPSA